MNIAAGYAIVFLGGGLGAALRHGVNRLALTLSPQWPAATLLINITGCLLMGVLTGWFTFRGEDSSQSLRLLLTTGLLGGFTTFSAFSLDAMLLWQRGESFQAVLYVLGSVVGAIIAVFAGHALMRQLIS